MNNSVIDVYYVGSPIVGFYPSIVNVIRSWDDSLYIETNVQELAGERRRVDWTPDGIIYIDRQMISGGLSTLERFMLNAG
jgi:hypothetical protein